MRWAIALSAGAWILIGAVVVTLHGRPAPVAAPAAVERVQGDAALARCRDLGEAAAGDPACRAAWADARARFFGEARP
ncbi:hypothetical protein CFHF_06450 [Caulobacter flavus]|uniref:Conjugal transfer protein TrbK n=1 Tax=Caulobacter flavus TaxID=1679497 RepID=A0A2N5CX42_9CAUL|nr:putative entry exclusion protein TrbK-alt [Caulobacter flavus]AYV47540.1 hypothetical protein C1707_15450 [Caulobacter flavus]PLR18381.1 hypothetical protein CFHF_06450 [Caulobacter flavus]